MGLFGKKSSLLYYPGCYFYFKLKEIFELYQKIFKKLGIKTIDLDKKLCCGLPAFELGYENEARKLARKNLELFKENNVKEIITNCAGCFYMFEKYKELLPDWDVQVSNMWKIIFNRLNEKPRLIRNFVEEKVGIHDSSYFRDSDIYNDVRNILKVIGCRVIDIDESKENSVDSGASGSLEIHNKELVDEIAKKRVLHFKRAGIDKIVTFSPLDYIILKRNSEEFNIDIIDIGELIGLSLGILNKFEFNAEKEIEKEAEANLIIQEEVEEYEKRHDLEMEKEYE